jgi:hypothetical protein
MYFVRAVTPALRLLSSRGLIMAPMFLPLDASAAIPPFSHKERHRPFLISSHEHWGKC